MSQTSTVATNREPPAFDRASGLALLLALLSSQQCEECGAPKFALQYEGCCPNGCDIRP